MKIRNHLVALVISIAFANGLMGQTPVCTSYGSFDATTALNLLQDTIDAISIALNCDVILSENVIYVDSWGARGKINWNGGTPTITWSNDRWTRFSTNAG
jgi:hypothetical protein